MRPAAAMAEPPGLYVHVPFCRTKCPYCDFASTTELGPRDAYVAGVLAEAQRAARHWPAFDSLYLGGGTPSVLADAQLARLLGGLQTTCAFTADVEVTLEANPDDVTPARLATWRALGVTRLSLGAQSFLADELRFLGRRHDARQTRAAARAARREGFAHVALDVMIALPRATPARLERSLAAALALRPDHLSVYLLTVAPRTPFGRLARSGALPLPDEGRAADLFLLADARLTTAGFEHYEVSNYACGPGARSRHNQKYWHGVPYLGLGPAAHAFDGGVRRQANAQRLERYLAAVQAGRSPVARRERLTPAERRFEDLFLGLRTSAGVAESLLGDGPEVPGRIAEACRSGLLVRSGARLVPTTKGLLVANALAVALAPEAG